MLILSAILFSASLTWLIFELITLLAIRELNNLKLTILTIITVSFGFYINNTDVYTPYEKCSTIQLSDCYYDTIITESYRSRNTVSDIIRFNTTSWVYSENSTIKSTDNELYMITYKREYKKIWYEWVVLNSELYKYEFYIPKSHRM